MQKTPAASETTDKQKSTGQREKWIPEMRQTSESQEKSRQRLVRRDSMEKIQPNRKCLFIMKCCTYC